MKLVLILAVVGLAGGTVAGHFLKPPEEKDEKPEMAGKDGASGKSMEGEELAMAAPDSPLSQEYAVPEGPIAGADYVKLNKQFVVPIVNGAEVGALIVMSMAIEAQDGLSDTVFEYEPKLRDEFLRVLFKHARSGGFTGVFTAEQVMQDLRESLLHAARKVLGPQVMSVLVTDIVRQDI
ncbi:MAG: flagellar basal body-associated FliL family protein [Pseudomonadota bacterium]